jgi:hypothetical protein
MSIMDDRQVEQNQVKPKSEPWQEVLARIQRQAILAKCERMANEWEKLLEAFKDD